MSNGAARARVARDDDAAAGTRGDVAAAHDTLHGAQGGGPGSTPAAFRVAADGGAARGTTTPGSRAAVQHGPAPAGSGGRAGVHAGSPAQKTQRAGTSAWRAAVMMAAAIAAVGVLAGTSAAARSTADPGSTTGSAEDPAAQAGRSDRDDAGADVQAAPRPFGPGERATYRAGWGIFGNAGRATLEVTADSVRGVAALRAVLAIRGGIPGARIEERLESWMDATTLTSLRYTQRTRYPSFQRDRAREFFPAERRWTGHTNAHPESGELPTSQPLDELAFLFHARTLDLQVGREYVLEGYWKPEGNPVRLQVLRREVVRVPAGTFNAVVVKPIIRTSSMFAEGGDAEVWFAEAAPRMIVMLRAKSSIASLTLRLEQYEAAAARE